VAEDSDLERTEPASSRRIEKAREEGQVPQSRELGGFLVMLSGTAALWLMGDWFTHRASSILRHGLSFGRDAAFDQSTMATTFGVLAGDALIMLAPLFLAVLAAAVLGPALIGGWIFSPKAMNLDLTKLNPLRGLGRMFSLNGVGELVKAVLKAILIGGVVTWVVWRRQEEFLALLMQPLEVGMFSFFRLVFVSILALLLGMAVIAGIDVPFQLWQYYKSLRMTREELKQENKELEGDPQLKARIRSQQREQARKRMMSKVPQADVVVTNPSHYAVALKYDGGNMAAPQVVAKGMNLIAAKIRQLAVDNGIPLLEAPPLARALYRHADVGEQIPAPLYTAVAEVLAYVYQLHEFSTGSRNVLPPTPPADLKVPEGMDPGLAR
jgi:flagellar biosynthetic protein FlhB